MAKRSEEHDARISTIQLNHFEAEARRMELKNNKCISIGLRTYNRDDYKYLYNIVPEVPTSSWVDISSEN